MRIPGLTAFSSNMEPQVASSLDARGLVETAADLFIADTWLANDGESYVYPGMTTVVYADPDTALNGLYRLRALPVTDPNNWAYVEGSSTVELPDGMVILRGRVDTIDDLPTADNVDGDMYLVGLEEATYFDKYVYIEDSARFELFGTTEVLYSSVTPIPEDIGGIKAGTVYTNEPIEKVMDDLINPDKEPVLVAPTSTLVLSKLIVDALEVPGNLVEVGQTFSVELSANYDAGTITPAYGTSGKRAGAVTSILYSGQGLPTEAVVITDASTDLPDIQTVADVSMVMESSTTWYVVASHLEGEQPLTSKGNNYSTPLEAGDAEVGSVTITAVYPIFGTTTSIDVMTKLPLQILGESLEITLVAENDGGAKQSIEYKSEVDNDLTGIEFYNTLSNKWEWLSGSKEKSLSSFAKTTEVVSVQGTNVDYKKYTNTSAKIGSRLLRFHF